MLHESINFSNDYIFPFAYNHVLLECTRLPTFGLTAIEQQWRSKSNNRLSKSIEFFTNSPQYKNANIANFILAMPFRIDQADEVYSLDI